MKTEIGGDKRGEMIYSVTQRCSRCKKHKPIECFSEIRRRGRVESYYYCKICQRDYGKMWRSKNRDYHREYQKEWQKEYQKEYQKEWLGKHPNYFKIWRAKRRQLSLLKERHQIVTNNTQNSRAQMTGHTGKEQQARNKHDTTGN